MYYMILLKPKSLFSTEDMQTNMMWIITFNIGFRIIITFQQYLFSGKRQLEM